MSDENEVLEAPNWLSELEKKREKRLKARLGHEAGAGAPCLKCNNECPGLDLHFWRKICKNCKCSKEDHDVHDDDIYGWAQFQLLGNRPNKIKTKIVLPGKKDEVELDWAPKGQKETIDNYLKTLPPESLPVKGSQAAQTRKQLLQKQIPIHDIDPSLCHELTESELKKMQDYIDHMKKNSVGIGQVIQLGLHQGGQANASFVASRYPKAVHSVETVQLQGENLTHPLTRQFETLGINDQKELDAFFDKIPNPANMAVYSENLGYMDDPLNYNEQHERYPPPYYIEGQNLPNPDPIYSNILPRGTASHDRQKWADPTFVQGQNLQGIAPGFANALNQNNTQRFRDAPKDGGNIQNYKWDTPNYGDLENLHNLPPSYSENIPNQKAKPLPPNYHTGQIVTNPNEVNQNVNYNLKTTPGKNLPHYAPGKYNIHSDQQNPANISNVRDLAFTTYDPDIDVINSNYPKSLQSYNPNQYHQVPEDQLMPNPVNIGAIKDINYGSPEVKSAKFGENKHFDENVCAPNPEVGKNIESKRCKKCSVVFKENEFAIFVERSNSLYHSNCFKCNGCNQSLADMMYFYDKESDNIYCGRDFAKIRGIPRCKACDELIFVKEYCLAENTTFHVKHFCCFECDQALAGQNYVMEDTQPLCLPCFEKVKANKCEGCLKVIKPDEQGANLNGIHFHATDDCFACKVCRKPLLGSKLLLRNRKLYCSHDCFGRDV